MSQTLKGNAADAVAFLKMMYPQGPWALTSIEPDKKGITTQTFYPAHEANMLKWIEQYNGKRNLYWHVNPVIGPVQKKAEREDILEVAYLHVDIDPRPGEDIAKEQERSLGMLRNPPDGLPTPHVVVFSGGGYQAFWRLEDAIPINGELALAEDAKRYNQYIERLFAADNCHNIDRLMRLPGTINLPDAKKAKKGRVPALAKLVKPVDAEGTYPLTRFVQAPKVQTEDYGFSSGRSVEISGNVERLNSVEDLNQWGISDYLKVLIVQGTDPDNPGKYSSRSEALFSCACQMVRHNIPDEVIFSVLTDPSFGIAESVVEKRRPEQYAIRQIERAHEEAIDPMLRQLNEKHAVIGDMGGKCRIISEVFDHAMKRHRISRQSFEDFKNRYRHIKVVVGTNQQGAPIEQASGTWWINHPMRRQFETLIFAPGHEVPEAYNLWKGFACDAIPGHAHEQFLDHVRKNICGEDDVLYTYLVGWMARAVQQPDSPGEVAIVLRGGRGTGKSFFVKGFGSLFGRHFLQVSDPKHLVGSFNAHLRDTVILFGDEAFYAGDKKHESILKTLITEEVIMIEGKGVDAEAAPNYVHLMMASNSDWVVPAGGDERRFFAVDVKDTHKQDRAYFAELKRQMEDGGRENLLHYLMTYDLSNFEVRAVPKTAALQDQKLLSLTVEEQWWYEKLHFGRLIYDHEGWHAEIQIQDLQADYVDFANKVGSYRKLNNMALGKFLGRVIPPGKLKITQRKGEIEIISPDGYTIKRMGRPYFYEFPPLEELRQFWDHAYGGPYNWQPVGTEQQSMRPAAKPF